MEQPENKRLSCCEKLCLHPSLPCAGQGHILITETTRDGTLHSDRDSRHHLGLVFPEQRRSVMTTHPHLGALDRLKYLLIAIATGRPLRPCHC